MAVERPVTLSCLVLLSSLPRAAESAQELPQPPPELAAAGLEEEVDEGIESTVGHSQEAQRHRQVLSLPVSYRPGRPRGCQPGSKVGQLEAHEQ